VTDRDNHATEPRRDDADELWSLQEVADAAREIPYQQQPDRLRRALAAVYLAPSMGEERPRPPFRTPP
jgi:hypothetical protein